MSLFGRCLALLTGSDGGRKLVYGTESGVYVSDRKPRDASFKPKRVLDCKAVSQIDVLEQHQIVLVLAEKTLYSYAIEALDPDESQTIVKRPRKICHANFFKAGICLGQHLVACVRTTSLSTTIKVFEPKDNMANKSKKSGFAKMLAGGQDQLKPYKVWCSSVATWRFGCLTVPGGHYCLHSLSGLAEGVRYCPRGQTRNASYWRRQVPRYFPFAALPLAVRTAEAPGALA